MEYDNGLLEMKIIKDIQNKNIMLFLRHFL